MCILEVQELKPMFDMAAGDILPWGVLIESTTGGIPTPSDAAGYNDDTKFEFFVDQQGVYDTVFPDPTGIPRVLVVDTTDMTIHYKNLGNDLDGLLAAIDELLEG